MKKFFGVIKRNIFYIALIAGMAVLVAMVTLYNMKMESKDKNSKITTEEANAGNNAEENNDIEKDVKETISGKDKATTESADSEATVDTTEATEADSEITTEEIKEEELSYDGNESISWPISGNIIIPYSMDTTVYFETLSEYKCSPAMVIEAQEGDEVKAVYKGRVSEISSNEEIGNYLVLDLGNGYLVTYGQLQDIDVALGNMVEMGDVIGTVSAPTRYYTKEGANLYFKITKDDNAVDPMLLID